MQTVLQANPLVFFDSSPELLAAASDTAGKL
jgi:hypothetical protein